MTSKMMLNQIFSVLYKHKVWSRIFVSTNLVYDDLFVFYYRKFGKVRKVDWNDYLILKLPLGGDLSKLFTFPTKVFKHHHLITHIYTPTHTYPLNPPPLRTGIHSGRVNNE